MRKVNMAEREQMRKPTPSKKKKTEEVSSHTHTEETSAEMDDLLDEIDEVLEANAEDFVKSYVQKGGQ